MLHVLVSDLHLTDGTIGEAVSPQELVEDLLGSIPKSSPAAHLVLLGDIFELLRSSRWTDLWNKGSKCVAPWKAMSPDFKGFPKAAAECAVEVLKGIASRYGLFARALQERPEIKVHYIPGNHDYMVQLIPEARKIVKEFLSLQGIATERPFPAVYTDENAGIYASHGNKSDPLNYHREQRGRWAFGDAIVLRLVNVFIESACDHLGQPRAGGPELALAVQDLDNVEPSEDLATYFRFFLKTHFTAANQAKEILSIWRESVSALLKLTDFEDEIYNDNSHKLTREALELSCNLELAPLLVKLRSMYANVSGSLPPELSAAQNIYDSYPGKYRFIVSGHTHHPRLQALRGVEGHRPYYVNTGCWRRLVTRRPDLEEFRDAHARTRFVVETEPLARPRYRLVQESELT